MAISWTSFTGFVQQQIAAVQGAAARLIDTSVGSITLAFGQASSLTALTLQNQAIKVSKLTRFATSYGLDADSWGADFSFTRLPAVAATIPLTFARSSATSAQAATIIPYFNADGTTNSAGALVAAGVGGTQFGVATDTTNPLWNAMAAAYVIPSATVSGIFTGQALVAGSVANVQAGTLTSFVTPITYIETVTNAAAVTNGVDAETDAAYKARFQNFINSRSRATEAAITNAVLSVQQGLTCQIVANVDTAGNFLPGNFVVYVDDGTGDPPDALITSVSLAIAAVAGFTISYNVQKPTVVSAAVVMTIIAAPGYTSANLTGPVATAETSFINGLGMGASLPYSRLPQIAYDAVPGVGNVTGLTVNGGTADIGGTQGVVVRVGSMVVNPG